MLAIIGAMLPVISEVLGRVIPDPSKAAEAQAELTRALIDNQAALNNAMAEVMKADSASEGWLTRSARPLVVLWGLVMVTWIGVAAPMIGLQKEAVSALQAVPSELWNLISIGIGGYMLAKTVENGVKALAGKSR